MSMDGKPAVPASDAPRKRTFLDRHKTIERNASLLLVGSLLVVAVGGIVEIAPLFYLENISENVEEQEDE